MGSLVLRCLLFVPGNSFSKLTKAFSLSVDAVVVDWEDAILPRDKASARSTTLAVLGSLDLPRKPVIIRSNAVDTQAFELDCESLASMPRDALPDGLMVPKCSSPGDIVKVSAFLDQIDPAKTCGLYALIESPQGVVNAPSIGQL